MDEASNQTSTNLKAYSKVRMHSDYIFLRFRQRQKGPLSYVIWLRSGYGSHSCAFVSSG